MNLVVLVTSFGSVPVIRLMLNHDQGDKKVSDARYTPNNRIYIFIL